MRDQRNRRNAVVGVAALLSALLPGLAYADGPAVSQLNGKISAEGGEINAHPAGVAIGSITAPLFGPIFGGQLDLGVGTAQSRGLWGAGGQFFARDPGIGLVGVLASYNSQSFPRSGTTGKVTSSFAARFGVEGAYYWNQFTPQVQLGYQSSGYKSGAYVKPELNWYPIDDLVLTGGADVNPNKPFAIVAAEYQPGFTGVAGLTAFTEAGVTFQHASYALVGIRYYFGPDKTLIRRHREDDPPNLVGGPGTGPGTPSNNGGTNSTKLGSSGSGGGGT